MLCLVCVICALLVAFWFLYFDCGFLGLTALISSCVLWLV